MSSAPLKLVPPIALAPPAPVPVPDARRSLADRVVALFLLVVMPVAAHLGFSRFGYNPTDDGFILAYSRRLLDGQVPHRDFISIRPAGSALLHLPWVLLGGDHAYLLSRLAVWFELGLIAWCWVRLARRFTGVPATPVHQALLGAIAFVLTANTFPVMAWHTIDALALASAGLFLASSSRPLPKGIGYALLGGAALCRQNFLPLAPIAALLLGDRRRSWVAAAFAAPIAAYGAWMLATGALPDALAQLSAQSGLQQTAFMVYSRHPWTLFGVLAGLGALVVRGTRGAGRVGGRGVAEIAVWALLAAAAGVLGQDAVSFSEIGGFGLFGASLGAALGLALVKPAEDGASRLLALALLVAWCTSISIGLNSPLLACGLLGASLLAVFSRPAPFAPLPARLRTAVTVARAVAVVALVSVWGTARLQVIYRERPAAELHSPLDGVLPGGAGIRTNAHTQALLRDLQRAIALAGGRPYAIVPDFAGWWAKAPQQNPLSIDWAQSVELSTPALRERVLDDVERLRARGGVVIVAKVAAGTIAEGDYPIGNGSYFFVPAYVRTHLRRVGETAAFELYR